MTIYPRNKNLKDNSRRLRTNATDAERRLWSRVRQRQLNGLQFYRQRIIGNYIVDFFCPRAKLVVELDGSQHHTEAGKATDETRDDYLGRLGLRVLHFSNLDILADTDGVVKRLLECIGNPLETPLEG